MGFPEVGPGGFAVFCRGQRWFGVVDYVSPEFWGAQLSAYGMFSKDMINEASSNTTRYEYNPYYAGLGMQGYIGNANYRYRIERLVRIWKMAKQ